MSKPCMYCKKEFTPLRNHYNSPPKYCLKLRETLRCTNGCDKLITDEPLEEHRKECAMFNLFKERADYTRQLDIHKSMVDEKLTHELWVYNQRYKKHEKELLEKDKKYEEKEKEFQQLWTDYTKLLQTNEKIDNDYKELIRICASTPKTTNNIHNTQNNTINQYLLDAPPLNLTNPTKLQLILEESYTKSYFLNGAKGLASFLVENYLTETGKTKYLTSDAARFNFKFNDDGNITTDQQAQMLIAFVLPLVLEVIHVKFIEPIRHEYGVEAEEMYKCLTEIQRLKKDNSDFCRRLVSMTLRDKWVAVDANIPVQV